MKRGGYWPFLLAALLLAGVGANLYFLARALSDPSFAVEGDYYAKAVAWDAHQAQARANADLGWSVAIDVSPADLASGQARVAVHLRDREGRPVRGAAVSVEAFHNARAAAIVKTTFREDAAGAYLAEAPIVRPGLWEFRLTASADGRTYTAVVDQAVPGATP